MEDWSILAILSAIVQDTTNKTYPNCESGTIVGDGSGPGLGGRHSTTNAALDSCHGASLLGSTHLHALQGGGLNESCKHVV
jgi:hypothetical protein